MADESAKTDPPQIAYGMAFTVAIVLLVVVMFRYPLW